jgi:hypothetical protein
MIVLFQPVLVDVLWGIRSWAGPEWIKGFLAWMPLRVGAYYGMDCIPVAGGHGRKKRVIRKYL